MVTAAMTMATTKTATRRKQVHLTTEEEEGDNGQEDDDNSSTNDSSSSSVEDDVDKDDNSDTKHEQKQQQQLLILKRLTEMKIVLDKTRSLDKKLRYQIDKLLAGAIATTTSSSSMATAFATGGRDSDSDDDRRNKNSANMTMSTTTPEDPLQYRPDPKSLLDDDDDDDDGEEEKNDEDDDEEEDDDLVAARQAISMSKQSSKNKKSTNDDDDDDEREQLLYRAPRLTAVPYTHDVQDQRVQKEKRNKRRLRASELAQTLKAQYGDAPDQDDVHGGANADMYGKQRAASRKLEQQEKERIEYEESAMIRLTTSRKEKKEKKRIERMMEGGSNLNQIANLGNLVRETEAFGRNDRDNDDVSLDEAMAEQRALEEFRRSHGKSGSNSHGGGGSGGGGSSGSSGRHANGKRKRESIEGQQRQQHQPKAKNSLQAALYGGRRGGGLGSSKNQKSFKKKSKR